MVDTNNRVMRGDGRIEIQCQHGIGHTTYESAVRCAEQYGEITKDRSNEDGVISAWLSHGCDGCCRNFPECNPKIGEYERR